MRVSELNGCASCVDLNASLLAHAGVPGVAAHGPQRSGGSAVSEDETLALAYADAMTAMPPDVDDALFVRLRAAFTPEAIVEITAVIAFQNLSARFNAALEAVRHGFCAVPVAASGASAGARPAADNAGDQR